MEEYNIQTFLDDWIAVKGRVVKPKESTYHEARPARFVRLVPAGYPLREMPRNFPINVADEKLFQIYAREQWAGTTVKTGDYLFDQRIIPDFAFKVIKTLPPGEVTIGEGTIINMEEGGLPESRNMGVTLRDIIGHEEVKRKAKIVMKYLEDPEKFGEWAPRNVLFYGPPGTGKTMTAKALATETDSSLYLIRATELIGEFVGDGSKKIHELYHRAIKSAPSVIFIDELDAIGLDRSFQSLRGDVAEIVNALLTELDGIQENAGILTIAATNNPNILDVALKSRFEELLEFNLPREKERLKLLEHYSRKLPMKVTAELGEIARKTRGLSGRDIKERLLKTSLHRAILEGRDEITQKNLEMAIKVLSQKEKTPEGMFS